MQSDTLKSKSFWTGLAMIVTGTGMLFMGDGATGIQTIAAGFATIFVRDAISKATAGKS